MIFRECIYFGALSLSSFKLSNIKKITKMFFLGYSAS